MDGATTEPQPRTPPVDHADEPERFLVRAITRGGLQLEEALADYRKTPSGEPLHDLRVALRRTTALAALLGDFPEKGDGRDIRKRARSLRRGLSPARQSEVSRELLPKLAGRGKVLGEVAGKVCDGFSSGEEPEPAEKTVLKAEDLVARLLEWQKRASRWEPGRRDLRALSRAVTARLAGRRQRLLDFGVPATRTLHPARIAGKGLRYQLEIVAGAVPQAEALVTALKPFQDALGDAHDLICLESDVRLVVPALDARDRAAGRRLLSRVSAAKRAQIVAARRSAKDFLRLLEEAEPVLTLEPTRP